MRNLIPCLIALLLCSCYGDKSKTHDALTVPEAGLAIEPGDSAEWQRQQDSISFTTAHHYTRNYNFRVKADSLCLYRQQPEEIVSLRDFPAEDLAIPSDTDSIAILRGERLVVAEIRIMPTDSVDTVWVQLARDQATFGWIHESRLLPAVTPDDPISQFIDTFSNAHILWTLIVVGAIVVAYTLRIIRRKQAKIIHFNDISSFYPTLLILTLAFAATVYATIQMFASEMWRHFYYHPTLNPFAVPPLLGFFLTLVWALPIIGIATVDDVRRHLPTGEAVLYLAGLAAVCMVVYAVFSVFTLYYIGYGLLAAYVYYSIKTFYHSRRLTYYCGRCGKAIHHKGRCPYCGAENI